MTKKETGLTKDSGYQVGVRKTFNIPLVKAWSFLLSEEGLEIWLQTNHLDKWETGIEFTTPAGVKGKIRIFKLYSHIRISWKPEGWENKSILQVRTIDSGEKTTISFHHEQLADSNQRQQMKIYWQKVLERIEKALTN